MGIKKSCQRFEKELAKLAGKKAFYKYTSSKTKVRQGISDLEKPDGTLTTSDKEKAETLNSFFSSVFTVEEIESPAVQKSRVQELLSNVTFTVLDVEKRLIALKPDKSPWPDKIYPRVLREQASQVAYPLYIIFKKSLSGSELPASWKLGHITPIFKKGSKSEASNYRPVSLTSVVCKTLEHPVRADIMKHL